jgi:pilus assembly protein CpaE
MTQPHILVVDDNEVSAKLVAEVLQRRGYQATMKTDPVDGLRWLRVPGNLPDLIVLDLMMPRMNGYEFLRQVRADPTMKHLPVILLTAKGQMDDKVAGYEAGADDYLVKPVNAVELELRIRALLSRVQSRATSGDSASEARVFSVFSLRGGVGTTSLAVNLAVALSTMWRVKLPLVDLALKNGHCALMLNLKPKYTLTDLVEWEEESVDVEVLDNLLISHESGVRLLPAPVSLIGAELVNTVALDRVWPYLRSSFPFIVVDAGSEFNEAVLTVLERSNVILLVLSPEMAALKAATDAVRVFSELKFEHQRILPIVNWIFPKDGLPQRSMEKALGYSIEEVLPYERTSFVRAINGGRPLVLSEPDAHASTIIARLAYGLSAEQMEDEGIAHPSPLLVSARRLAKSGGIGKV